MYLQYFGYPPWLSDPHRAEARGVPQLLRGFDTWLRPMSWSPPLLFWRSSTKTQRRTEANPLSFRKKKNNAPCNHSLPWIGRIQNESTRRFASRGVFQLKRFDSRTQKVGLARTRKHVITKWQKFMNVVTPCDPVPLTQAPGVQGPKTQGQTWQLAKEEVVLSLPTEWDWP